MNNNFDYLDGRITTVGSAISGLQSDIASVNTSLGQQISNINATLQAIYPVGSIYIGTMDTCPLAALFGTWTKKAAGKVLQGADSNHEVKSTIAAGLPNITGRGSVDINSGEDGTNYWQGALSRTFTSSKQGAGNDGVHSTIIHFNASNSNTIYGNSTTVQPPAYVVNIWERTA